MQDFLTTPSFSRAIIRALDWTDRTADVQLGASPSLLKTVPLASHIYQAAVADSALVMLPDPASTGLSPLVTDILNNANSPWQIRHDILSSHTVVGSAMDVVGLSAVNTLAVLTPSYNPGATAAILRTDNSGKATLTGFTVAAAYPEYLLSMTGESFKSRVAKYAIDSVHLSSNLYYDGANWQRESTAHTGTVVNIGSAQLRFRYVAAGANPASLTDLFYVQSTGQLQLPVTGSGAGILLGGDTQLYRSAADVLRTPDSVLVDGYTATSREYTGLISHGASWTSGQTIGQEQTWLVHLHAFASATTSLGAGVYVITRKTSASVAAVVTSVVALANIAVVCTEATGFAVNITNNTGANRYFYVSQLRMY